MDKWLNFLFQCMYYWQNMTLNIYVLIKQLCLEVSCRTSDNTFHVESILHHLNPDKSRWKQNDPGLHASCMIYSRGIMLLNLLTLLKCKKRVTENMCISVCKGTGLLFIQRPFHHQAQNYCMLPVMTDTINLCSLHPLSFGYVRARITEPDMFRFKTHSTMCSRSWNKVWSSLFTCILQKYLQAGYEILESNLEQFL